jgi:hypothetical protein
MASQESRAEGNLLRTNESLPIGHRECSAGVMAHAVLCEEFAKLCGKIIPRMLATSLRVGYSHSQLQSSQSV